MIEGRLYRMRNAVRVGDILYMKREVKSADSKNVLEMRIEKVRVVEKYPHLVRVEGEGPELPIRTLTYNELLVTDTSYGNMRHNRYMLRGNKRLQRVAWT